MAEDLLELVIILVEHPMDHLEAADPDGNNVVANVDLWTRMTVSS